MSFRTFVATLFTAAVLGTAGLASAEVVVPVKDYVKPGEPMTVRVLAEKGDEAKKAVAALGWEAAKLDTLFTPANALPEVTLFTAEGKTLKPEGDAKLSGDGSVDLAALFPQVKEAGTYYVIFKNATPLVVETLRNPVAWQSARDGKMRPFVSPPVVTHIVPLQYAEIKTDKGVIKAKFAYDKAPHTIDNFISLADQRFYDNSGFHRIIKGFMIQGGDSLANSADTAGTGGPGYNVPAELNDKKHERGTLSMARMGFSLDTAGSQFFIMHGKTPSLDNEYTAFGDVFEGLDVVDAIANTPTSGNNGEVAQKDRPKIVSLRILPATPEIYGLKK